MKKLKTLRQAKKLSLADLVFVLRQELGCRVNATSLNNWERGLVMPSAKSFCALCKYFNVPADFFN